MSFAAEFDSAIFGGQVQITGGLPGGNPAPPAQVLGGGAGLPPINGSLWVDGVTLLGSPLSYPTPRTPEATLMVSNTINYTAQTPPPPSIFKVTTKFNRPSTPLDVMLGDPGIGVVGININSRIINILEEAVINITSPITNGVGLFNWTGAKTLVGVVAETGAEARAGAEVVSAITCDNGNKFINGSLDVASYVVAAKYFGDISACSGKKDFDIPHPTKDGWRLRHVCIEGPTADVYVRGKLIDSTTIELPEYWRGLVDPETITVNLTPHGCYQELFVKAIEWGTKVIIQNNSGGPINCSYVVYGKRKDVPDLEVEYEGTEMRGKQNGTN